MTRHIIVMLTGALCLWLAFMPARRAVAGLTMPYDMDHFRDIAYAQSVADGKLLADPFYQGGTIWYNPLFPVTVAAVSKITALKVPTAFVQAGPFLSVLAQGAFLIVVARLVGPWPALIALVLLLFAPPHDVDGWAAPGVTPWVFPSTFAATFFYIGLLLCWAAIRRNSVTWWVAVGVSLGVTFLAHTAPALILGLCALASIRVTHASGRRLSRERFTAVAAVIGTAAVVSAPFLYSIVGRYGLHVVHVQPLNWVWEEIAVGRAGAVLLAAVLSPIGVLRLLGAAVLVRRAATDHGSRLVMCWVVGAAALFGYGWVQQILDFHRIPPLVPQHHFYFYLTSGGYVLAGVGAWTFLEWAVKYLLRHTPESLLRRQQTPVAGALVLLGIYAFVKTNYGPYQGRPDFQEYQREAVAMTDEFAQTQILERLRTQTPSDAVVLATALDSHYRAAPAGRAIVAMPAAQSNPYVAADRREVDAKAMLAALLAGDSATFNSIADQYHVTHVLLGPEDAAALDRATAPPDDIHELSRRGGYVLYARRRTP